MCDCVSFISGSPGNGLSYFAKNSDRDPNEMQLVEFHPAEKRSKPLNVTHIEIDPYDASEDVVISRPYWMWGAEMGYNGSGVSIGNEAIFTSGGYRLEKGLLGMDLLRIALELSGSALKAADVITEYLEKYGQGGSNSAEGKLLYNNSFLIADSQEILVMDIVGKEWRIRRADHYGSISNYSQDSAPNLSPVKKSGNFGLRHDLIYTPLGKGERRQASTYRRLAGISGKRGTAEFMETMRMHTSEEYHPSGGSNSDICMHSGPLTRINQTVNSMLSETSGNHTIGWFTFSSNPCISLYKPVMDMHRSIMFSMYTSEHWKRAETVHRKLLSRSRQLYMEAMRQTRYNQALIEEIVEPFRSDMESGAVIEEGRIRDAESSILEIDRCHLDLLDSLAESEPGISRTRFARWWERKDQGLHQVENNRPHGPEITSS